MKKLNKNLLLLGNAGKYSSSILREEIGRNNLKDLII